MNKRNSKKVSIDLMKIREKNQLFECWWWLSYFIQFIVLNVFISYWAWLPLTIYNERKTLHPNWKKNYCFFLLLLLLFCCRLIHLSLFISSLLYSDSYSQHCLLFNDEHCKCLAILWILFYFHFRSFFIWYFVCVQPFSMIAYAFFFFIPFFLFLHPSFLILLTRKT